jgi:ribosomal protein L29
MNQEQLEQEITKLKQELAELKKTHQTDQTA